MPRRQRSPLDIDHQEDQNLLGSTKQTTTEKEQKSQQQREVYIQRAILVLGDDRLLQLDPKSKTDRITFAKAAKIHCLTLIPGTAIYLKIGAKPLIKEMIEAAQERVNTLPAEQGTTSTSLESAHAITLNPSFGKNQQPLLF